MGEVIPFIRPFEEADYCKRHVQDALSRSHVDFNHPHFQERLAERDITMRQVLTTLQKGDVIDGPKRDDRGDYRIKMKRNVAGRPIQVVVALNLDKCTVVTVI